MVTVLHGAFNDKGVQEVCLTIFLKKLLTATVYN